MVLASFPKGEWQTYQAKVADSMQIFKTVKNKKWLVFNF